MCGEHSHVCSNKEHYYRAEGVGVAEAARPGNQFIVMQTCDNSSFLPKSGRLLQAALATHSQPLLGLNAFIFPIYSYRVSVSCDRQLHAHSIQAQYDWVGNSKDLLTEQSAEELTLEDIDDPVQRLTQLVVFLHQTLSDVALVLVSVAEFGPVLLQKLQGSLGIYNINQQSSVENSDCKNSCWDAKRVNT